MGYFLLVKTAVPTGLKYLCKCIDSKDPHHYSGSGVYWRKHLKKYNCTWTTQILGHFTSKEQLREAGLYYSKLWDVDTSEEWANYIPEMGDGGPTVKNKIRIFNEETKNQKVVDNVNDIPPGWKRGCLKWKKNKNGIEKTRLAHIGKKRSMETRNNMKNAVRKDRIRLKCELCDKFLTPQNIQRHKESKHG